MAPDSSRYASRASPYSSVDLRSLTTGEPPDEGDGSGESDDSDADAIARERRRVVSFVEEAVERVDAEGVVVAMSGGIDSTLTALLATEALGSDRVFGLLLPCNMSDESNGHDARVVAEALGIRYRRVQLRPLLDCFEDLVGPTVEPDDRRLAMGNAIARLRMTCAYYVANATNRLVLGTTNRTEWYLGYFTKHGDGGADLRPLVGLYKTQVYALAYRLGVPRRIVEKPSTAGLWAGQTDETDLGAPYEVVDAVLARHVQAGRSPDDIAAELDVDSGVVRDLVDRYRATEHKRRTAPAGVSELTT